MLSLAGIAANNEAFCSMGVAKDNQVPKQLPVLGLRAWGLGLGFYGLGVRAQGLGGRYSDNGE